MKLNGNLTINGKAYQKGDEISWLKVYPFFMVHMLMFGGSGFMMAYSASHPPLPFMYMHGGIAILVYTVFYLAIFGVDEVKWMFINAALGFFGIYTQIGWILQLFGKQVADYPLYVHVTPFLYFVLYTFLLRQAVIDITHSRDDETRKKYVEYGYIAISLTIYLLL